MLDKLKYIKEQITQRKNANTFDATRFNDPLAKQIQWKVLKSDGSSFQAYKLVEEGVSRMESEPTLMSKIFSMSFIIIGLAIPFVLNATGYLFEDPDLFYMSLASIMIALILVGVGVFLFRKLSEKMIFDKLKNRLWVDKPGKGKSKTDLFKNALKLSDIYAIQLISKFLKDNHKSYYIYELNIVMGDTHRYNILRHGNKRQIRRDAKKLAKFLGKPLWDATD